MESRLRMAAAGAHSAMARLKSGVRDMHAIFGDDQHGSAEGIEFRSLPMFITDIGELESGLSRAFW